MVAVLIIVAVATGYFLINALTHRRFASVGEGLAFAATALLLLAALAWCIHQLRRDWVSLISSESYLTTTLRSIAEGVILTDVEGHITLLNGAAEVLTGWREDEAKGKHFRDVVRLLNRETRQPLEPLTAEVVLGDTGKARVGSVLLVSRDGTERIIHQSASAIRGNRDVAGVALICRDVTERELADAAFRASQKTFRLITENMSDVVTLHDVDGRVLFQSSNKHGTLIFPENANGEDPFSHVLEEDRQAIRQLLERLISTGQPQRLEYRMHQPGGGIIFVESVGTLVRRSDGTPDRVVAVSRDISKRREIEQRLLAEKEFNDTLLASLPGIFFVSDPQGRLLRWNHNFEIVVGHTSAEIAELDITAFFPLQEQPHVEKCLDQCLQTGKTDIETTLWHQSGRLTAYYVSGLRFEINHRPAVLCVGIDVSARKAAEEALVTTSQRLERQNLALAEQARNPALRGDDLGVAFRTITEVASRTLGVSRTSIWFYQRDDATIHCEDLYDHSSGKHTNGTVLREGDFPSYFRALSEGRVIPAHYARNDPRTRDFSEIYLKPVGITSMLDAPVRLEGKMIGVICHEHTGSPREWTLDEQNFAGSMADLVALSLEVWQRRQAERALREARDQLEVKVAERTRELSEANEQLKELDRLKSEFLATMSHELRTPMNSIIGFTGILRQELAGPLNDEQKKQLGMVNFSARHLLDLINDLLDLSRIESGKAEISLEQFTVDEVVCQVIDSLKPAAAQKGLSLEREIGDPEKELHSDKKRVFQILLNLANNAVKFTDRGSVKIVVQTQGSDVQFDVIDSGIGIKPEQLANLFQAFRQVDGSAKRVYEGTGLGLYLCKKLVNMLGGTIGAESRFGVGSRFYFTLPAAPPKPTKSDERQDSSRGR
jgi:PAS domain S-box-containing protein